MLEVFDACVYVFGMQSVIFQGQKECACSGADDVIGEDVAVFPRKTSHILQYGIPPLPWRN